MFKIGVYKSAHRHCLKNFTSRKIEIKMSFANNRAVCVESLEEEWMRENSNTEEELGGYPIPESVNVISDDEVYVMNQAEREDEELLYAIPAPAQAVLIEEEDMVIGELIGDLNIGAELIIVDMIPPVEQNQPQNNPVIIPHHPRCTVCLDAYPTVMFLSCQQIAVCRPCLRDLRVRSSRPDNLRCPACNVVSGYLIGFLP